MLLCLHKESSSKRRKHGEKTDFIINIKNGKGLSQRELANALNFSAGIIGLYETGKRTPSLKNAKIIANYFDVALEDISFANNKWFIVWFGGGTDGNTCDERWN